ncbi:MAG: ATP-dependent DNA ligase [Candidatus Bathyarchaeia archaeon]
MLFEDLCNYFERLEETQSRNSMISILAELFQEATENNIDKICYFIAGDIVPGYKDINLGMGEEMTKASLSMATGMKETDIEERLREGGDLGDVAAQISMEKHSKYDEIFDFEELTVDTVHRGLVRIASTSGENSKEIRKKTMAALLSKAGPNSRRYLIRLALGKMRLGVGHMTILDGLAASFLGSKDERPPLEHAFNVSSDIGYVGKILAKSGLDGVKRIRTVINRPVRPQLAQRVDRLSQIREKIDSVKISVEEKYDGERIQAHKKDDGVRLFSRRLNEVTHQFPEIVENVMKHVDAESAIIDGEAVAYNFEEGEYNPFQKIMRRRRKYDVDEYAEKIPVKYMVFDLLYLNGRSMMRMGYTDRTGKLHRIVPEEKYLAPSGRIFTEELDRIDEYFQSCIERGLEGIICKSTAEDSYYHAGAREWSWIKWKPSYASELSDTLDLVVVGAYAGKGKRGGTYGALLCASYNPDEDVYETVTTLGTGFTDEQLAELPDKLKNALIEQKPARVKATDNVEPDYWFNPEYVLEVRGSEITNSPVHTCNWDPEDERGLAVRFPRFERWRPDKSAEQATTTEEIVQMSEEG